MTKLQCAKCLAEMPDAEWMRRRGKRWLCHLHFDLVPCAVPDCRHTMRVETFRKRFGYEPGRGGNIICHAHWMQIPKRWRMVYGRLMRREKKFGVQLDQSIRIWRRILRELKASE